MKFLMSDNEIRVSYNTAKDQKAQIKILAELNVTTPAVMAAKLRDLGCDVPDPPSVNQQPLRAHDIIFDETRARELFAEGKSDLDIAEMLGIGVYAFAAWRRKNGMKRSTGGERKKMEQKAKPKRCKAQPPMPPEIEMPQPGPATATAAPGSHSLLSAQKQISAADLGCVLLDLADRYPGIVLTVNGTAVRSLCLNVRVMMGEDTTTSTLETLDLEVR